MSSYIIEVEKLSAGYGRKTVLEDINLTARKGEFMGVIGPNGSGKTTLLRALTRVIPPTSGTIKLYGKDILQTSLKELARKIAVVSQAGDIDMATVEEYVLLGRIPHYESFQFLEGPNDIETADKCMRLTGISHLKDKPINHISEGERQLAFIARALTQEPEILLLDEPTSHLDIAHKVQILDLIEKLNKKLNLTVIMVLHDLNLASEYCDKITLLEEGRVHSTGTPEEILDYKVIEKVYKTVVVVRKNPFTGKPYVMLVPGSKTNKSAL